MKLRRLAGALLVLTIACTGDGAMGVHDYADHMNETESAFEDALEREIREHPDIRDVYPLGGDLVGANLLFQLMERRLSGWQSAAPPEEFADLHASLVSAMTEVQRQVGEYLLDESMSNPDFHVESIETEVRESLTSATSACLALQRALEGTGAEIVFANGCDI